MRGSILPIIILSLVGIIAVLMIAVHMSSVSQSSVRRCTYTVDGDGAVMLTYRNESGGIEQKTVALPWALEMRLEPGSLLYVSAQKQQARGTIRAVIYLDGQALQQAQADSAYGIAAVSGRVP